MVLMRCVVCGVGNRLRGDDAAGPVVVEKLRERFGSSDDLLFIDCGSAPENFLSKIKKFGPSRVVVVDAVELGMDAGAVEVVDTSRIRGFLHSTHQLPLSLFFGYLEKGGSCEVVFVGVQPKAVGFGVALSKECEGAIDRAVEVVSQMIA